MRLFWENQITVALNFDNNCNQLCYKREKKGRNTEDKIPTDSKTNASSFALTASIIFHIIDIRLEFWELNITVLQSKHQQLFQNLRINNFEIK